MRILSAACYRMAAGASTALMAALLLTACGQDQSSHDFRDRYQLTGEEAAAWERLYVAEAESVAAALWGHIGHGEYDQAMFLVDRYGDERLSRNFETRIQNVWAPVIQWPAADFTKEPQIGLGAAQTIGFRTWGELLSGGFQRVVLADDSITVFFVLKGHWKTETIPVYAAVACGDFGEQTPQWRPFAHIVFSADASEEAVKSTGQAYFSSNLEEFVAFLRKRTFGSFGF
jgi:hypothetical protein